MLMLEEKPEVDPSGCSEGLLDVKPKTFSATFLYKDMKKKPIFHVPVTLNCL